MKFKYKTLTYLLFTIFFSNSYASIDNCMSYIKSKDWDNIIKYCPEYSSNNGDITKVLSGAYAYKYNGLKAQKYLQIYIDKFANEDKNKEAVALAFMSLGNYYYFGEDGAKKDIKKGLKYITKGAQLGNSIAQEQLGNFYLAEGEYPAQNMAISYKWFEIASINGNQKAKQSYILTHLNDMKKQAGYCLAMGQQLVAESYINGEAGLPKSDNQAKNYLIQAIELYKEAKQPSEDELKYCPPQKGLDLASAEKLLASLQ
ncbi:sel1 repeat family protein [Francisella philomiragia]|uniref:Sel1 repeat family protein n=1 Tax=Francisella philomiragia TaxID=28110 RepID=A0AAW3DB71_9GAMM|nr:sel1 repeat family protein [Francisella philomiragia]KFJ42751.1 sel1 repeat family protein [Francisella philomiragia]MBK2255336.1 sel1 repeat family protein [Francisella philomiragia]MBK2273649.1 sel1 repeat family protein [Francisella philomiragia]MBK2277530.1 sel1 repeat family protein [Francisella philomiragia]MBK2281474.1 sel1 repeat family protein [Francisella philomiragia]